jgi:hypothetical protein
MKRALLILSAIIGTALPSLSQVTGISVETYYTDDSTVPGYPAGHSTYRIYANTTNPTDRVSVVSGDANTPLVFNVSGQGIWNHPSAGVLGDVTLCSLFDVVPVLEYDSYITVGYECNDDGAVIGNYRLEDSNQPWQAEMFGTSPYGIGNTVVNSVIGATWFALTDNDHTEGGIENRVLLAQITTDGSVCGILNLQVFPNYAGPGSPNILQNGLEFGNVDCGVPGCVDAAALNFDPAADFDNGLCIFECDLSFGTLVGVNPTCGGDEDGSIEAIAAGNQSYVQYSFESTDYGLQDDAGLIISDLANGTYSFTIHDTRFDNENLNPAGIYGNCTVTQEITINTDPVFLTSSTATSITCNGDGDGCANTLPANYGGGNGDLTFKIYDESDNAVQDGSGDLVLPTPDYCSLDGGTYYFELTDANGCTATGESFTIVEPSEFNLFEGAELAASCFNSSDAEQVLTWGGGTGDVDFSTEDDGTYEIEGNPSNAILTGLTPGQNMIYAQDENGCQTELTFTVAGGPVITVDPIVSQPACNGDLGSITVAAAGGTGVLSYSFDCVDFSSTATMNDVSSGNYQICVKDENDCIASSSIDVVEPAALEATATLSDITCFGLTNGSVSIVATGGTPELMYSLDGITYVATPDFSDLGAGAYMVHVMDANDCMIMLTEAFNVVEPAELTIGALTENPIDEDPGGNNAYTVEGGTGDYSYEWTNSVNAVVSTSMNLPDLTGDASAGTYTLEVTDENGCTATSTLLITGVGEVGQTYSIALYPNPNNGEFVISLIGLKGEKMNYAVIDANGRVVIAKELGNVGGTRMERIDMSSSAAGIYHVQFNIGAETQSMRFVKN